MKDKIKETFDNIKTPEQLLQQTKILMFEENERLHKQASVETIEEKPTLFDNIRSFFANSRNIYSLAGAALVLLVMFFVFPTNRNNNIIWNNASIDDLYVKDITIIDGNKITQEEFESITDIPIFPLTKIAGYVDKQFSKNNEVVNAVLTYNKSILLICNDNLLEEKYKNLDKTVIDDCEVSFMKDDNDSNYALWNKDNVWFLLNSNKSDKELLKTVKDVIKSSK